MKISVRLGLGLSCEIHITIGLNIPINQDIINGAFAPSFFLFNYICISDIVCRSYNHRGTYRGNTR